MTIRHFTISTCKNKTDTHYINRSITWQGFIDKLKTPVRTTETLEQYKSADSETRAKYKDGAGFVGGKLKDGRRIKENVLSRSMLTFDIDDCASPELISDIQDRLEELNLTAVLYGTHSYTPQKPRCRLIVPLDEDVEPNVYEFLARQFADELIGIDFFDSTTFQPSRMMFLPSIPKDAEWFFHVSAGAEYLHVDAWLDKYPEHDDPSTWVYSESEQNQASFAPSKDRPLLVSDPSAKDGIVGAFCSVFTPSEAIDFFLSDVYERSNTRDRYTYVRGTAANGLRIYPDTNYVKCEDQSDPANIGTSINAFDLVRIHKFGHLDSAYTGNMQERPSFKKMCEYALTIPKVEKELRRKDDENEARRSMNPFERDEVLPVDIIDVPLVNAPFREEGIRAWSKTPIQDTYMKNVGIMLDYDNEQDLLEGLTPAPDSVSIPESSTSWKSKLQKEPRGKTLVNSNNSYNVLLIMRNDPNLHNLVGTNLFKSGSKELTRRPIWEHLYDVYGSSWTDKDEANLRTYFSNVYHITNANIISDCLEVVSTDVQIHPVKDFILSEEWDEIPRVDTVFIDYLGAENTPYVREVTRKWFTAAVKRIFEPACKWDYMPVLIGSQGIGKSLLIRKLGREWTQDTLPDLRQDKASYEALDGYWLIEMGELAGMKKADRDSVKSFITKTSDDYRKAYGHNVASYKRTCVFVGTTNDMEFLNDTTGNRRFLPILCNGRRAVSHPWNMTDEDVRQIWSEAYLIYKKEGSKLMSFSKETNEEAIQHQIEASLTDEWTAVIRDWLEEPLPVNFFDRDIKERQAYYLVNDRKKRLRELEGLSVLHREKTCIAEIWCECFGRELKECTRQDSMRISQCLSQIDGWTNRGKAMRFGEYGSRKAWVKEKE